MVEENRSYWPFVNGPPKGATLELPEQFAFFEAATRLGFHAFVTDRGMFGLDTFTGRQASIIHRGKARYWEVCFVDCNAEVRNCFVEGFQHAAEGALAWVSGGALEESIQHIGPFVVSSPGERGW